MNLGSCKYVINKMCLEILYLIDMYKKDLALNNLQWLICHQTKQKTEHPFRRGSYRFAVDTVYSNPYWQSERDPRSLIDINIFTSLINIIKFISNKDDLIKIIIIVSHKCNYYSIL